MFVGLPSKPEHPVLFSELSMIMTMLDGKCYIFVEELDEAYVVVGIYSSQAEIDAIEEIFVAHFTQFTSLLQYL